MAVSKYAVTITGHGAVLLTQTWGRSAEGIVAIIEAVVFPDSIIPVMIALHRAISAQDSTHRVTALRKADDDPLWMPKAFSMCRS